RSRPGRYDDRGLFRYPAHAMEHRMTATSSRPRPTFEQYTAIRRYQPALAFSPDGSQVAYSVNISGQYNLWRQPADGGYPVQITLSAGQSVREIEWSPDGESIVYTADNDGDEYTKVYRVPARGGEPEVIAGQEGVRYYLSGGFSPDGRSLTYAGNDREETDQDVILRDETTGEDKRIVDYGGIYYPAHWSPDGKRFLALDFKTNTNQDIYVVDVASEEATLVTPHEGEVFMIPAA